MLIPVKYGKRNYPPYISPLIQEVPAHFDIKEIKDNGFLSLHTEYSYRKRNFNTELIQNFPTIRKAHRHHIPQLWYNEKWALEFAEFIIRLTENTKPVVIEIHLPFNDYSNFDKFLSCYTIFEQIILEKWPRVDIVLENRCGTRYVGGNFLVSQFDDLEFLVNQIEQKSLKLKIALDLPQLFTAHGGHEALEVNGMEAFILSLIEIMRKVKSIHLWGKRRNQHGQNLPHQGDLNSYFDGDNAKKQVFLNSLRQLLMDYTKRYFVPEVNSSSEDLQSIVRDLEEAGIQFINIDARDFFPNDKN